MFEAHTSPPVPQQCETLLLLFKGPSGTARIGRFVGGAEAGRTVLLREVAGHPLDGLTSAVSAASALAHPSLVKVLGLARTGKTLHIASEFMVGASLLQVAQSARRESLLEPGVCLKIIHDALVAANIAKRVFQEAGSGLCPRTIFADTVWIAEFGETLLTEVGISPLLHEFATTGSDLAPDPDVPAAGAELRRLLTGPEGDLTLTAELRTEVTAIIERSESQGNETFPGVEAMVEALEALPAGCMATEDEVGAAIGDSMRLELQRQHSHLNMQGPSEPAESVEGATSVFNPHQLDEQLNRPTERPPGAYESGKLPLESEPPEPAAELAEELSDSSSDETQIFMPVFSAEGRGPTAVRRQRPGAYTTSTPPLEQPRTTTRSDSAEAKASTHPRGRARAWLTPTLLGALLLLALLAALVAVVLNVA